MVIIEMDNGSTIKLELDATNAPITTANFLKLVNSGFYDGLTFHRVIRGFMIQGGDPRVQKISLLNLHQTVIQTHLNILAVLFLWLVLWIQILLQVNSSLCMKMLHT